MSKVNTEEKSNLKVSHELVTSEYGDYISEVQTFNKPVDYEEAFEKYYPKNN